VGKITVPERITPKHDVAGFDCGIVILNTWLKERALKNEDGGASRTYVICSAERVVGYYALAAGSILNAHAPGAVRRNMPDPIPVILLGRLAVDKAWQGKGFGKALLRDAVLRTIHASEITGVRALLVHAISEEVKSFYQGLGFRESSVDPMTLAITIEVAKISLLGLKQFNS
jgi:GNAT superfamily N-acetyltransferase